MAVPSPTIYIPYRQWMLRCSQSKTPFNGTENIITRVYIWRLLSVYIYLKKTSEAQFWSWSSNRQALNSSMMCVLPRNEDIFVVAVVTLISTLGCLVTPYGVIDVAWRITCNCGSLEQTSLKFKAWYDNCLKRTSLKINLQNVHYFV